MLVFHVKLAKGDAGVGLIAHHLMTRQTVCKVMPSIKPFVNADWTCWARLVSKRLHSQQAPRPCLMLAASQTAGQHVMRYAGDGEAFSRPKHVGCRRQGLNFCLNMYHTLTRALTQGLEGASAGQRTF